MFFPERKTCRTLHFVIFQSSVACRHLTFCGVEHTKQRLISLSRSFLLVDRPASDAELLPLVSPVQPNLLAQVCACGRGTTTTAALQETIPRQYTSGSFVFHVKCPTSSNLQTLLASGDTTISFHLSTIVTNVQGPVCVPIWLFFICSLPHLFAGRVAAATQELHPAVASEFAQVLHQHETATSGVQGGRDSRAPHSCLSQAP